VAPTVSKVLSAFRSPVVWVPAVVLALATAVFRWTDLDVSMVRPFFARDASGQNLDARWPLMVAQPWKMLYDWGVYPAWIIGCGGMVVWIVSFLWTKFERWRDPGLFFALLLIVGPGIVVNVLFKPYWSRPRPHATIPFGGEREFLPVWQRGSGQEDSSFPSGHAAMGFYLMAPALVCYRRRPGLAAAFLLLGLAGGAVIGLARVVAGCHFPSDVLWAGGLIYFTALLLAAPFRFGLGKPVWDK
jgi:lipid A 4'-phosphatase